MTDSLSPRPRVAAVCVLYGSPQAPQILLDLADRDVEVVIVDNSSDLQDVASLEQSSANLRVVTPGRNLGYSRGVNAAVGALRDRPDALLVVNPDIVGDADALIGFAGEVAASPGPVLAAPTGGNGSFGFLTSAPAWLVVGQYAARTSWHPAPRGEQDRFLSGALLGINREALELIAPNGELLVPELFFMDDVELTDRARRHGAQVVELPTDGELAHVGGTSMRRRPAVRIYFSRVSKVRYWQARSPWAGRVLRGFFLVESAVGRAVAGRSAPDGSAAHGFAATTRWLARADPSIDDEVLGNNDA